MATAKSGKPQYVGVDDGHWGIKIYTEDGKMFTVPSRARSGRHVINVSDDGDSDFYSLEDGGTYTVNPYLTHFEDTRFKEYPKSALNAVLVHHALYQAGFGGQSVAIETGLPVSHYYLADGTKDQTLIEAKRANLKRVVTRGGGQPLANIVQADVTTEAIAAYIDLLIDDNGNPSEHAEELQQSTSGFIDIGGRTTDSVVLLPGQQVVTERSGSSDVGVLQLNEAVASKLRTKFDLDQVPPLMVEKAIRDGTVRISGKEEPVGDLVRSEKEKLAEQIMAAVRVKIGSGKDLEFVEFVGGGAIVMRDQLAKHFPHARFPVHPEYANARGMMKIAKYILGGA
ncbi:MAG: ParM/StbA family protein [Rhodanobacter sp.]